MTVWIELRNGTPKYLQKRQSYPCTVERSGHVEIRTGECDTAV